MGFAERAADASRTDLGGLADLLERQGISVDDIGQVRRISLYQQGYKDADGEALEFTDASAPTFLTDIDDGDEDDMDEYSSTPDVPDPVIGFRRSDNKEP